MTSSPVITSVGLLTALGAGRQAVTDAWREGQMGEPLADGAAAGGRRSVAVKARGLFPEQRGMLRRMDRLSRLISVSAALARDDGQGLGDPKELGLAVGTDLGPLEATWNFLTRLREKGPALANPMDFPNLVPNAGAGYVGILLGLQGPSQTFCQHELCGDEAIAWAADGVRTGWFPGALAGGAEEFGEVRARGQFATRCSDEEQVLGEGSALLLVESQERAEARQARPLARHLGFRAETVKLRSPLLIEFHGDALERLVSRTLDSVGARPEDVGAVLASPARQPEIAEGVERALGRSVPATDHDVRFGTFASDGALRVGLAALLLSDRSLPVNANGELRDGPLALVVSVARGGGLCASLLGEVEA